MKEKTKFTIKYLTFSLVFITVALILAPVILPLSYNQAHAGTWGGKLYEYGYGGKDDDLGEMYAFDNSPKISFADNKYKFTYKFTPTGGMEYRYILGNNATGFFRLHESATPISGQNLFTTVPSYFAYVFTVNRHDGQDTDGTPVKRVAIIYDFCGERKSDGNFYYGLRRTTASISLYGTVNDTFDLKIGNKDTLLTATYSKSAFGENVLEKSSLSKYERDFIAQNNFKIDEIGVINPKYKGFDTGEGIDVSLTVPSASLCYSIDFMAQFVGSIKANGFFDDYGTKRSYSSTKDTVPGGMSVYQRIKGFKDAGKLETEFSGYNEDASQISDDSDYAKALKVLGLSVKVKKKIRYLEEIKGTPFATQVEKIVTVSNIADTNEALHDEVCSALGITCFKVLDSYENADDSLKSLGTVNDVEILEVNYLKTKWLRSFDHNGQYVDYFLGLESYYDYYHKFIRDETGVANVFDKGLYDVYLNSYILTKYPQVAGRTAKNIYGYFGFVAIPQENSLNAVLDYFFDTKTSKCNVLNTFDYKDTLSFEAYNKLLTEYKYTWLKKAFYNVTNFVSGSTVNVKYYMFYSDKGENQGYIGENGADDIDDDHGKVDKIGKDLAQETAKDLDDGLEFLRGAARGIWGALGGVIDGLNTFFNNNVVKTILPIVLLAGVGVFLYIKFFPKSGFKKGGSGGSKKRSKKK